MYDFVGGIRENAFVQGESIKLKYDKRLSNFIVGYFFVHALNLFVKLVIGDFGAWNLISRGSLAILLVFCIPPIYYRNLVGAVFAELLLILCLGFTILSGGADFSVYNSIMVNAVTVFLPMGIALTCIEDKSILAKRMYIMSWPTHIVLAGVLLNLPESQYSMPGGYALVFQMLIVMDHFFQKRKWYDLAAIGIDFFLILFFGSRGPIVCIMTMIVIRLLFSHKMDQKVKWILIISIVVITTLIYLYYEAVLTWLISVIEKLGYFSRNLRYITMQRITDDSGRDSIHKMYFQLIKDRPVLGYGLIGGWTNPGTYPHHIFIELLLSFGVVLGPIACVAVSVIAVKGVTNRNENEQRLAQIMFAYCVSLFLSDSFMMCPMFFLLMGLGLPQKKTFIQEHQGSH